MQFRRSVKNVDRKARETRMFIRAMQSGAHPILAQVVPIRRCNLDCAYCNEYDKTSNPVPTDEMLRRIDHLGGSGQPSSRSAAVSRHCIRIWMTIIRAYATRRNRDADHERIFADCRANRAS